MDDKMNAPTSNAWHMNSFLVAKGTNREMCAWLVYQQAEKHGYPRSFLSYWNASSLNLEKSYDAGRLEEWRAVFILMHGLFTVRCKCVQID